MISFILYFKRQKTLIKSIKSLGDKLREERKQRQEWQKLAMNSLETIREIESAVVDARSKHRDRASEIIYGD